MTRHWPRNMVRTFAAPPVETTIFPIPSSPAGEDCNPDAIRLTYLCTVPRPDSLLAKPTVTKPYASAPNIKHDPQIIGDGLAHEILPRVHLIFANLKEWAKGAYHGLRPKHLQSYLGEHVFRSNRRHGRVSGFRALLRIATGCQPVTCKMLIAQEARCKNSHTPSSQASECRFD